MPDPKHIAILLICLNAAAFLLYGFDKFLSKSAKARRIPEKYLLVTSALLASPGAIIGMVIFNHKTSKPKFRFGVPALLAIHAAVVYWLTYN